MPDKTPIPDQDDVLAANERLTTENRRLTAELTAATELLEAGQTQLSTSQAEAARVPALIADIERMKAENSALGVRMADFNRVVASEVQKLGLRPKAAEHKEAPADPDLTPTQRVLAAKGVGSIRELSPKLNP